MEVLDPNIRLITRKNFVLLCSEIDNVGLSLLLYQRNILSNGDLDNIFDRASRRERNVRLLQIILRKSNETFNIFCQCLIETGREDLKKIFD